MVEKEGAVRAPTGKTCPKCGRTAEDGARFYSYPNRTDPARCVDCLRIAQRDSNAADVAKSAAEFITNLKGARAGTRARRIHAWIRSGQMDTKDLKEVLTWLENGRKTAKVKK